MPSEADIREWPERIRERYESYLRTSFFFRDRGLRESFREALREGDNLLKGPFKEPARAFQSGRSAHALAAEWSLDDGGDLTSAFIDQPLYMHQERAIRLLHEADRNVVVATGTASGKTESFLYPVLMHLYRQHLSGELDRDGVRALVLYPMNALANDQRERLGKICRDLKEAGSSFRPTFGQYIGQTPENRRDGFRHGRQREEERLPGELVFREEMRDSPPHILLTNYSMLEYLLIRPDDSPLFDAGVAEHWRFLVLDEAHQYRGAKGMEMAMLLRRLKQRLRAGGRSDHRSFRCIATSATLSTGQGEKDREAVARFAETLFGEPFASGDVVFAERKADSGGKTGRYHAFLRALEGAFLVHRDGQDVVRLNRVGDSEEAEKGVPIELALCRECGQHYYVGKERSGALEEAIRDPSQTDFGVDYFLPVADGEKILCRRCGELAPVRRGLSCDHGAGIEVRKCASHREHKDQLQRCEACGYSRGGVGDPVQEIIHGSDGPNAVIATALHELLPEDRRRVLAFADNRQEAAFFAWYAEDSYRKLRDRNLLHRALMRQPVDSEGLSIEDLASRLFVEWDEAGLFRGRDTRETRRRNVLKAILREVVTEERRLSLAGVGLARWAVALPPGVSPPPCLFEAPWNLTESEAEALLQHCLSIFLVRRSLELPRSAAALSWKVVTELPQTAFGLGPPGKRRNVAQWGAPGSALVRHYLARVLGAGDASRAREAAGAASVAIWSAFRSNRSEPLLARAKTDGTFYLDGDWLRLFPARAGEIWECDTCKTLTPNFVRGVCPRNGCTGTLEAVDPDTLPDNHYRHMYRSRRLPVALRSEEHTAQVAAEEARRLQGEFKDGAIHLLSSSTTFEVGVSLGDLDVVFLRNVPPEPFNYVQRVGRAGRGNQPGLAVTYCRRNPHDLHHYGDPEERVIHGEVAPPRLHLSNERIVLRHMAAVVLAAFFRENRERFDSVETFMVGEVEEEASGDRSEEWGTPRALRDVRAWCEEHEEDLTAILRKIVPPELHGELGLMDRGWVDRITGSDLTNGDHRLARAEAEVRSEYLELYEAKSLYASKDDFVNAGRVSRRMKTVAGMRTLNFLSRKAVIPKYGFPVDVVELNTWSSGNGGVVLQRDLSQAIAEYAPGGKVVANKLEWESCGLKKVAGKEWEVRRYRNDDLRNFEQWDENNRSAPTSVRKKYLIPRFGFVTPLNRKAQAAYPPRSPLLQHPAVLWRLSRRSGSGGYGPVRPQRQRFCSWQAGRALRGPWWPRLQGVSHLRSAHDEAGEKARLAAG